MDGPRNLFTIPAGSCFVDALADGLWQRLGGDHLDLSRALVLLPTRRACRALGEAFLRRSGGRATLLPRMRPLGDVDEDELGLADAAPALGEQAAGELPPAIAPLRRQLLLARLVQRARAGDDPLDAAQAADLAAELARLLDQVQTERLSFDRLADLVPRDLAGHWRLTLDFLRIVTDHWPAILVEEDALDPAARRDRLLAALAVRWRETPPDHPVIAAGSTGSIPATAELLGVISRLPQGAVVLPGLDTELDEAAWTGLDATHPQYGLRELLHRLGAERDEVASWPGVTPDAHGAARRGLLSEALRPAETTGSWRVTAIDAAALAGLRHAECTGLQEEARVIALALREVLETPGRTAALVTPDRDLARRTAVELSRWGVEIDDSGGVPLANTAPGNFLRLSAAMIAEGAAPVPLLAALKHPLAGAGLSPGRCRVAARRIERLALRGPAPAPGFEALARALREAKASAASRRWLTELAAAAEPFALLLAQEEAPLAEILRAHVAFAEWLATTDKEAGAGRLWAGEAGEAAADFVHDLATAADAFGAIAGASYPASLAVLMRGRTVRPRFGRHARLHIWGLLEARLQQPDLLILGGLNEGTWPAEPPVDPWLSRPMRSAFGLPSPERRIGLAAHDFVQAAAAPEVLLTRSLKVEGAPTVPSRWLLRLQALLQANGVDWEAARWRAGAHWQQVLDEPGRYAPAAPPEPRPPVDARPRRLSVTRIGVWMRDPYAIYARHVLGLRRLDPLNADPGAAERGEFVHRALDRFLAAYPERLPDDALERLLAIGREALGAFLERPSVGALWWPRFECIARWFVAELAARPVGERTLATEVDGRLELAAPAGAFTLTAKADRIDGGGDGLVVIDYKTGATPPSKDVKRGFEPQLPLEALLAQAGAFAGIPAAPVAELAHWRLTGGDPAGEIKTLDLDPAEAAAAAREGLLGLIARFDRPETPYRARPRPRYALLYNDYEHLARVREWGGDDGEAA